MCNGKLLSSQDFRAPCMQDDTDFFAGLDLGEGNNNSENIQEFYDRIYARCTTEYEKHMKSSESVNKFFKCEKKSINSTAIIAKDRELKDKIQQLSKIQKIFQIVSTQAQSLTNTQLLQIISEYSLYLKNNTQKNRLMTREQLDMIGSIYFYRGKYDFIFNKFYNKSNIQGDAIQYYMYLFLLLRTIDMFFDSFENNVSIDALITRNQYHIGEEIPINCSQANSFQENNCEDELGLLDQNIQEYIVHIIFNNKQLFFKNNKFQKNEMYNYLLEEHSIQDYEKIQEILSVKKNKNITVSQLTEQLDQSHDLLEDTKKQVENLVWKKPEYIIKEEKRIDELFERVIKEKPKTVKKKKTKGIPHLNRQSITIDKLYQEHFGLTEIELKSENEETYFIEVKNDYDGYLIDVLDGKNEEEIKKLYTQIESFFGYLNQNISGAHTSSTKKNSDKSSGSFTEHLKGKLFGKLKKNLEEAMKNDGIVDMKKLVPDEYARADELDTYYYNYVKDHAEPRHLFEAINFSLRIIEAYAKSKNVKFKHVKNEYESNIKKGLQSKFRNI